MRRRDAQDEEAVSGDDEGVSTTKKVAAGAAIAGVAIPAAVGVAKKVFGGDQGEGNRDDQPTRRSASARAAKRSTAKRSTAKGTSAKRSTAKRAPTKRSAAKRASAKRSTAKRSTAKKRK